MEKLVYVAPEADIELLDAQDVVLISVDTGNPSPLPTIPWNGTSADW